jgi:hypothetical protein
MEVYMKATSRKGWPLILEMAAEGAIPCGILMLLLFYTGLGDTVPEVMKLWAPIGIWLIGIAFFIAHRTPEGYVEFKIWRKD